MTSKILVTRQDGGKLHPLPHVWYAIAHTRTHTHTHTRPLSFSKQLLRPHVLALQSARMRSPRRVFAACSSQLLTLKNYAQFISFFPPCLPRLLPQLGAAPNFCPAVMAAPGRQDSQVIAGHNTAQGRSTLSVHGHSVHSMRWSPQIFQLIN